MRKSSTQGKFVGTCKLCKLLKSHPEIWMEIHDRVLKNNESMRSVRIWLNEQIRFLNIDIKNDEDKLTEFHDQNFVNHFTGKNGKGGHCVDRVSATIKLRNSVLDKKNIYGDEHFSAEEYAIADAFFLEMTAEQEEYTKLSDHIYSLEGFLSITEKNLKEKMERNGKLSLQELDAYQKQILGVMSLRKDLISMRNTAPLTGKAIKETSTMLTTLFLEQLIAVSDDLHQMLTQEFPSSRVPDEAVNMLKDRMASLMKSGISDIIKKVSTTYKIKIS